MDHKLARTLRKNATPAERALWRWLGAGRTGFKFKRQQPVGPYVADFVCFEKSLVIEVDGGQHMEQADQDRKRSGDLEKDGFRVLRFWNNEVMGHMDAVLEKIQDALRRPLSLPSPTRGEEEKGQC